MTIVHDPRKEKDKQEPKRWSKFVPKNDNKESMNVNVSPVKFTPKERKKQSVEVVALKEVRKENVANFIRVNIIYRFGIPRYIIIDNGKPFDNKLKNKICDLFGFEQCKSSIYHAAANGLVEALNKNLCKLLKKVVSKSKRYWHEIMEEALWAYRTTYRTPTQATPYSLAFGVEAVLPLECQIPSLRLAIQEGLTKEENARLHLGELEELDEKRLEAQ
ncbi:uncharacterized protein [Solanum tuberosum]|uniref:uncharacterized protein n=1 Tax=Solanum tuberosum TaxID=4113 RepID=UPI00073A3C14|nr:PREDICTED: uncharacterized protein LOC107062614 [Solanum tuberosum]